MHDLCEQELSSSRDLAARKVLLASRGLREPGGEGRILGLFDAEGDLVATGSRVGDTLQGFAVSPARDGEGLLTRLVSSLLAEALADSTLDNVRVFTKTDTARTFSDLGFSEVLRTQCVTLLEWHGRFKAHLATLKKIAEGQPQPAACVVMNANPVTLGHAGLVARAAETCEQVYVFVVQEERSTFPFADRLAMVRAAVERPGVIVLPGGPYIISSATFPSYFIRDEVVVATHAELDLRLFAMQAAAMGITRRFAGEEPYCVATDVYNTAMLRILPPLGVEVTVIPRFEHPGAAQSFEPSNAAVSASRVRALLGQGKTTAALALVPKAAHEHLLHILPTLMHDRNRVCFGKDAYEACS